LFLVSFFLKNNCFIGFIHYHRNSYICLNHIILRSNFFIRCLGDGGERIKVEIIWRVVAHLSEWTQHFHIAISVLLSCFELLISHVFPQLINIINRGWLHSFWVQDDYHWLLLIEGFLLQRKQNFSNPNQRNWIWIKIGWSLNFNKSLQKESSNVTAVGKW